jgi:hypothetical protein
LNDLDIPMPLRAAAILLWINGVGFGVCCLPGIRNLLTGRAIPMILGFPAYGRGPFERVGIPTTVPLLAGFLLVCILEVVAGWLVWSGATAGAVLAIGLLPVGAIFWCVLIVVSWRSLR